jgi:hypothetical protein
MALSKKSINEAIDNILQEYSPDPIQRGQEMQSWQEIDDMYNRDGTDDEMDIELDKNLNTVDMRDMAHSYAMNDPMHKKVQGSTLRDHLKAQFGNNITNESKNVNKKLIRLTEDDLHRIVRESVENILQNNSTGHIFSAKEMQWLYDNQDKLTPIQQKVLNAGMWLRARLAN